jgi:hypothetical protein
VGRSTAEWDGVADPTQRTETAPIERDGPSGPRCGAWFKSPSQAQPDVVVAIGGRVAPILNQMSRSIPMVVITADPVGVGIADSLARPGANITEFSLYEFSIKQFTVTVTKIEKAK